MVWTCERVLNDKLMIRYSENSSKQVIILIASGGNWDENLLIRSSSFPFFLIKTSRIKDFEFFWGGFHHQLERIKNNCKISDPTQIMHSIQTSERGI